MKQFLLIAAGGMVAVILGLVLGKQNKESAILLTLVAVCMIAAQVLGYLKPVIDFIYDLANMGQLDANLLKIIMKSVGIGLISEIAELVCADSGNAAIGKTIQLLASVTVLWLSLPLMKGLLEMVQRILGGI